MLLTQKTGNNPEPFGEFNMKDMYKAQWKRVQVLADAFRLDGSGMKIDLTLNKVTSSSYRNKMHTGVNGP